MRLDRFKFRAWHKPTKRIFEVWAFNSEFIYQDTTTLLNFDIDNCVVKTIDCVLEQCTGLKDKNGNLIYEGDVLQYTAEDGKCYTGPLITNINYILRFVNSEVNEDYEIVWSKITDSVYLDGKGTLEVIGNIHENPELLEEK